MQRKTPVVLKVIIETCLLDDAQKALACQLACEGGADFVKTSTGFSKGGAQGRRRDPDESNGRRSRQSKSVRRHPGCKNGAGNDRGRRRSSWNKCDSRYYKGK